MYISCIVIIVSVFLYFSCFLLYGYILLLFIFYMFLACDSTSVVSPAALRGGAGPARPSGGWVRSAFG